MLRNFSMFLLVILPILLLSCSTTPSQCDNIATISAETARFICTLVGSINAASGKTDLTPAARVDLQEKITAVQSYLNTQAETSHQLGDYLQRAGDPQNAAWQEQRAELLLQLHDELNQARARLNR